MGLFSSSNSSLKKKIHKNLQRAYQALKKFLFFLSISYYSVRRGDRQIIFYHDYFSASVRIPILTLTQERKIVQSSFLFENVLII